MTKLKTKKKTVMSPTPCEVEMTRTKQCPMCYRHVAKHKITDYGWCPVCSAEFDLIQARKRNEAKTKVAEAAKSGPEEKR